MAEKYSDGSRAGEVVAAAMRQAIIPEYKACVMAVDIQGKIAPVADLVSRSPRSWVEALVKDKLTPGLPKKLMMWVKDIRRPEVE